MRQTTKVLLYVVTLIVSMSANADLFGFSGKSWKEEVLLHDGTKVIVKRAQTRGGRHEIGQEVPVATHTVSFSLPGKEKSFTWKSEFGLEVEKASLSLLAIDLVGGIPYIVTTPTSCIAYNKWNRPNPPYVFFKFEQEVWQRVPLTEFPAEIKEANVAIGALTLRQEKRLTGYSGAVPVEEIRKMNAESTNPDVRYLKVFVPEPITKGDGSWRCEELVYYKGAWVGPGDSIGKRMMDRKSKQSSSDFR